MDRVAVLDDYSGTASACADWSALSSRIEFFRSHLTEDQLIEALANFDAVVTMRERSVLSRRVLDGLPRLRLIVRTGSTSNAVDLAAAADRGIVVCRTGGIGSNALELTWGLILAALRHLPEEDRAMREGRWQTTVGGDLAGRRLGLVGLGRIGGAMVPVAHAFSMKVQAWSPNLTADRAAELGVDLVSKEELFRGSDVVSVHIRLSERTRGLIGTPELALMPIGALLVNTSRGPIIDEAAAIAALRTGRIRAAFDVFNVEPLPVDHDYRSLENVVLSPHLGYATERNYRVMYGEAVAAIAAFQAGSPINVV